MCNAWNHPSWCKCGFGGDGHLGRGHFYGTSNIFNWRTSRRWLDEFCHPTKCPKCNENVFFIRHNGGSVWVDELGWPWPIHGCFQKESQSDSELQLLLRLSGFEEKPVPGIIVQATLDPDATTVHLEVETETKEKGSIEFKLDKVGRVVFDPPNAEQINELVGSLLLIFRRSVQIRISHFGKCMASRMEFVPVTTSAQDLPGYRLCTNCKYWIDAREFDSHIISCQSESLSKQYKPEPQTDPILPQTHSSEHSKEDGDQRTIFPKDHSVCVPPSNKLNWTDEELDIQERQIVEKVKNAVAEILDDELADMKAKRLAIETAQKLPRNLRVKLLPRFEKAKWRQFLR